MFDASLFANFKTLLPNRVSVGYRQRLSSATSMGLGAAVTMAVATKMPVEQDDYNQGAVTVGDISCVWLVWDSGEWVTPSVKSVIEEADGTQWTIKSIKDLAMGQYWRLVCVQAVR